MNGRDQNDRRSYDAQISDINNKVEDVKKDIEELTDSIKSLKADIHDLIYAWNTAKGITSFVKWLAGILGALAAVYAFMKGVK